MKRYALFREYDETKPVGFIELEDDAVFLVEDVIAPAIVIDYVSPKTGKAEVGAKITSFSILQERHYLRDLSERFKELQEIRNENLNKG